MELSKLIRPKSVAIIGASDRAGSIGNKVALSSQQGSLADRVYFVHPKLKELLGKPCYAHIRELPEVPDSVILCTPKQACPSLLEEAGAFGVPAAIVYAGGFSEEGTEEGIELENRLIAVARKYDMAVLGPNCNGITNNVDKIYMAMLGYTIERERPAGIGVISQSGYVTTQCVRPDYMSISYGVSVGNNNIVNLEDVMEYMVREPTVHVLAIYLEGVRNGEKFISLLREAAQRKKPVIILKTGRSALGAKAAASHTGSMAGSFARYKALLQKYNAVLTETMQEFVYTAVAMNVLVKANALPKGGRLGGITLSGAENVLCADMCESCGIQLPSFEEASRQTLKNILPPFATPNNPMDATTYYLEKAPEFAQLIETVSRDANIDMLAVNVEITENPDRKNMSEVEAILLARKNGSKPVFAMSTMEATRNRAVRQMLEDAGVPILGPGMIGYQILKSITRYAAYDPSVYDLQGCGSIEKRAPGVGTTLSEAESKALLRRAGISVPHETVARDRKELEACLDAAVFPLVLKINSRDITHKSDAGGVRLNITDREAALAAYEEILASCRAYAPDAKLDGVLVSPLLPRDGREMILGISNDAALGPFVLVGLGGVFTEVFQDVVLAPAPVSQREAADMLERLRSSRLLRGYRGGAVYDEEALCQLLAQLSVFAAEHRRELLEMDLNPVMVYPKGRGTAVMDALAMVTEGAEERNG